MYDFFDFKMGFDMMPAHSYEGDPKSVGACGAPLFFVSFMELYARFNIRHIVIVFSSKLFVE